MGIPTVSIASSEFIGLSRDTALGQGVADMSFVVVPHPFGGITIDDINQKARDAFPSILKAATQWKPTAEMPPMKPTYPAEQFAYKGTEDDINTLFIEKGWSLGLPIVPPTIEKVAAMLKGTSRKSSDVLGQVPPRMGTLTVELVATHAVMAGCKPEYMPVLIAAMEAMLAPEANWRGAATSTGSIGALVIVNGPIVKEIGLAYGQGAASRMHHANASLGYAIDLIAAIVGGSKPPSPKKTTLGTPADYVAWIFGENEDALPSNWQPYHVDKGFKKTESVVTVMGIWPPVNVVDLWSATPEELSTWFSHAVSPLLSIGGPCWTSQMEQPHIIGLGPEHADIYAKAGWTKEKIRKVIWEKARIPYSSWARACPNQAVFKEKFGDVAPDTLVPITLKPEYLQIVITGGKGQHSHYFAPFPSSSPVSKVITK